MSFSYKNRDNFLQELGKIFKIKYFQIYDSRYSYRLKHKDTTGDGQYIKNNHLLAVVKDLIWDPKLKVEDKSRISRYATAHIFEIKFQEQTLISFEFTPIMYIKLHFLDIIMCFNQDAKSIDIMPTQNDQTLYSLSNRGFFELNTIKTDLFREDAKKLFSFLNSFIVDYYVPGRNKLELQVYETGLKYFKLKLHKRELNRNLWSGNYYSDRSEVRELLRRNDSQIENFDFQDLTVKDVELFLDKLIENKTVPYLDEKIEQKDVKKDPEAVVQKISGVNIVKDNGEKKEPEAVVQKVPIVNIVKDNGEKKVPELIISKDIAQKDVIECSICTEELDTMVSNMEIIRAVCIPCGHTQTCLTCLTGISICPICRSEIQSIYQIY